MYMITALQTQAFRATGDSKYIDRTAREMKMYIDTLQRDNGLFYHAPSAPYFWGRGNGWMAAALPLILTYLPTDSPYRPVLMDAATPTMQGPRSTMTTGTAAGSARSVPATIISMRSGPRKRPTTSADGTTTRAGPT